MRLDIVHPIQLVTFLEIIIISTNITNNPNREGIIVVSEYPGARPLNLNCLPFSVGKQAHESVPTSFFPNSPRYHRSYSFLVIPHSNLKLFLK